MLGTKFVITAFAFLNFVHAMFVDVKTSDVSAKSILQSTSFEWVCPRSFLVLQEVNLFNKLRKFLRVFFHAYSSALLPVRLSLEEERLAWRLHDGCRRMRTNKYSSSNLEVLAPISKIAQCCFWQADVHYLRGYSPTVTIPKNSFSFIGTDLDWGYVVCICIRFSYCTRTYATC
jgi:hypothetical protein